MKRLILCVLTFFLFSGAQANIIEDQGILYEIEMYQRIYLVDSISKSLSETQAELIKFELLKLPIEELESINSDPRRLENYEFMEQRRPDDDNELGVQAK